MLWDVVSDLVCDVCECARCDCEFTGPICWIYVSDIFPTRTRHYGLALASASQWLWSMHPYTQFGTVANLNIHQILSSQRYLLIYKQH